MIDYKEYIAEQINKSISYSEYVADSLNSLGNISYSEYLYKPKNIKRKEKIKNLFK
jgi:hypothetical protein